MKGQLVFNPHRDIRVTKLDQVPPFYPVDADRRPTDPLGVLRELDPEIASRYGVKHCRIVGMELTLVTAGPPSILTTPDEFVVDVNPPGLPA